MKHNDSTSLSIVRFHFDLPTTAHRLGYRLREIPAQGAFVQNLPQNRPDPYSARAAGAWTLHPVKDSETFAIVENQLNMQHSSPRE